nr:DeoR/GlpR family DNA-binding transcription regulator [uncultured Tolumonas sp.]
MTQEERLIELEAFVRAQGKVTLDYICQQYQISYDSARRDLVKLTKIPGILRIRGGAILSEKRLSLSYLQRSEFSETKDYLARHALNLINENDIIFLDAGTTMAALAHHLQTPSNIITNSIEVLNELNGKDNIRKCVLGGAFDEFSHTILGQITIEQIKRYQADKTFLGVSALSEAGITTDTEMDALLKIAMAQQSKMVICIATFSKFNSQLMYQSCGWAEIDCVITDKQPPANILKCIEENEVELIIVTDTSISADM